MMLTLMLVVSFLSLRCWCLMLNDSHGKFLERVLEKRERVSRRYALHVKEG